MNHPKLRIAFIALLVCALLPTASAQLVVQTPIDTNFGTGWDGIMFDVEATVDLRLTDIETFLFPGTRTIEVWVQNIYGGFDGDETSRENWTLVGSKTLTVGTAQQLVSLGIPMDIDIPAGLSRGIYITGIPSAPGSSVPYTAGFNPGGTRAQNGDLRITEGIGVTSRFSTPIFGGTSSGDTTRLFNGRIHYSLGLAGHFAGLTTLETLDTSATGIVFDIEANEHLSIHDFALDLYPGTQDFEVWTTRDGAPSATHLTNPLAWQLVGSSSNFSSTGLLDRLGLDLNVPIAPGQRRGFYVTQTTPGANDIRLALDGTAADTLSDHDGKISLFVGRKTDYLFSGPGSSGTAAFSGSVFYRRNRGGVLRSSQESTDSATTTQTNAFAAEGMFFDLEAIGSRFVQVESLSTIFTQAGTFDVELWVVRDRTTHIGKISNQSLWSLVAFKQMTVPTAGVMTEVFDELRIVLEPGLTQGCYLTVTNGSPAIEYSSGIAQGNPASTGSWARVLAGVRSDYPFIPQLLDRHPHIEITVSGMTTGVVEFGEDFYWAGGIQPPYGWLSHVSVVGDPARDGWNFSNPQPIASSIGAGASPPIDDYFAVVDSDLAGPFAEDDAFLYSPRFDARHGPMTLSFDHWHRPLASQIDVDVWDGTTWNNVYSDTLGTTNTVSELFDISAATGGYFASRVRFRYQGAYDWHWALDNVRVFRVIGDGQTPRPGLACFDLNYAREAGGHPVASNLPGPYFAEGYLSQPALFEFEGEPNQPIILLQGPLNPNNYAFTVPFDIGKLDIGGFDPLSGTFLFVEEIASGLQPGFINLSFFTDAIGYRALAFPLPPFTVGNTYSFQSVILSNFQNAAFTNTVSLSVIN